MKPPRKPSPGSLARRIDSAFPADRPAKAGPMLATRDQLDNARPTSPATSAAMRIPRDRTIARAGLQVHDQRVLPAPIPHPGPTGGPVGIHGTDGPIGPWGSWSGRR